MGVAALRERYAKVKAVSDEWVKKVDILLKEWTLLDNTVTELNSWLPRTSPPRERTSSLWRRWSPLLESSRTSSRRRRSSLRTCKSLSHHLVPAVSFKTDNRYVALFQTNNDLDLNYMILEAEY